MGTRVGRSLVESLTALIPMEGNQAVRSPVEIQGAESPQGESQTAACYPMESLRFSLVVSLPAGPQVVLACSLVNPKASSLAGRCPAGESQVGPLEGILVAA